MSGHSSIHKLQNIQFYIPNKQKTAQKHVYDGDQKN